MLAAPAGVVGLLGTTAHGQSVEPQPPAYTATAAADGVRISVTIPGAPLTDVPLDVGGPSAQVLGNSLGTSQGYAAFPDPGPVLLNAPGLITGLLSLGAAGLPPIDLPSLPTYPLFVQSDAGSAPDQQLGSGPYELRARSRPGTSSASASGGLQADALGRTGLVRSSAELREEGDTVTVVATSVVEALTVGPLTLGNVTSTAQAVIAADGSVTPTSSLRISGARVGGVPIDITDRGLDVAGSTVPLDLFGALRPLLDQAGISVQIVEATQGTGQVSASGLKVTYPFDAPGIGSGRGTASLLIGVASASIDGVAPAPPSEDLPSSVAVDAAPPTVGDIGFDPPPVGVPVASAPVSGGRAPAPSIDGAPASVDRLVGLFDASNVYLVLSGAAGVAFVLSLLVSLIGARSWRTSSAG